MYLKSIELSGFKSFAEPTEIILEPGITSIVGPNGCGKSNVVDSIRWSLGELSPKTLRSKTIADVIFNGTRRLSPATHAQVTLTFDNSDRTLGVDSSEVAVSRKIFRDSASEYFINKSNCRLKDIKNLFLGTGLGDDGYSIMEGRMVDFLLTAKPYERRLLFDEASGAARFAAQRDEALSKLSKIEMDLDRVKDNIELIEAERKRLESQARKAKLFEKLTKEKKTLDVQKTIKTLDELSAKKKMLSEESVEPKRTKLQEQTTQTDQIYARVESLEVERLENEKILQAKNEAFHESARSRDLTLEKLKHLEEKLESKQIQLDETVQEASRLRSEINVLEEDLQKTITQIKAKEAELAQKSESAPNLESLKETLTELAKTREHAQETIRQLKNKIHETMDENVRVKNQILKITTEISQLNAELKVALKEHNRTQTDKTLGQDRLKENEALAQALKHEVLTLEQEMASLNKALDELQNQKRQLEETLYREIPRKEATKTSELEHWEKLYGDNPRIRAAKAIDEMITEGIAGIYGPIGKKIKASPANFSHIKDILGEKLQWYMAENAEVAARALAQLSAEKKGRATFILLDRISENIKSAVFSWDYVPKGQTTRIFDLEYILGSTDVRTKKAIFHLLGTVFIQGTSVYGDALIHGGEELPKETESQALTALEEREEIVSALTRLGEEQKQKALGLAQADEKLSAMKKQITELARVHHLKTIEASHESSARENILKDLNLMADAIVAMEHETKEKLSTIARKNEELAELDKITKELERASNALELELRNKEATLGQAVIEEKSEREATLAVELMATTRRQDLIVLVERKKQTEKNIENLTISKTKTENSVNALAKDLDSTRLDIDGSRKEFDNLETLKEQRGQELTELQRCHGEMIEKLQTIRREQTEAEQTLENLKVELNQLELELKTLEFEESRILEEAARIFEATGDELSSKLRDSKKELESIVDSSAEDLETASRRINERLEKLGQINFLAQEEYNRLEEKTSFLATQRDDILKAQGDVRRAIEAINAQIEESFKVTFDAVREKFREIFAQLFEGGEADLVLVDNENPLQKGVEIYAQPPGKKLTSIALLSQGEKALTAVSLLFAFFATKPAPVCVLDEIDAPLDEANVQRFRKLLETFSQTCQFLIITHNKRTMEAAHSLYGVTMEELGVSKLISVKLEEVAAASPA